MRAVDVGVGEEGDEGERVAAAGTGGDVGGEDAGEERGPVEPARERHGGGGRVGEVVGVVGRGNDAGAEAMGGGSIEVQAPW